MKEKSPPSEEFAQIKKKVTTVLRLNKIKKAAIFGSYARGDQTDDSDVDILIDVEGTKFSLFDLVGLELDLEKELGKKVDLITYGGINRHLKRYILEDEVRII